MKKTLVIYWSGTGNTEAMANAVVDGMKEAGADVTCWTVDDVKADAVAEFDAVAMGCPAMGAPQPARQKSASSAKTPLRTLIPPASGF